MTPKQAIYKEMRERAGGRPRLYKLTGASVSTIQAWEDGKNDPQGPTMARLVLMFPDLADQFLRALADGPDFDAANPPVVPVRPPGAGSAGPPIDVLAPPSQAKRRGNASP